MKITTRDVPPRAAWALEQGGIHPLLARLFASRGITNTEELDDSLGRLIPPSEMLGANQAAKALADAMKVKLEIVPMPFGELMKALQDNKVDMVMSGLSITPERTEMVSFVGPYMMSGKSILTKNSVLARIEASNDFNRKDLKLLALSNSTSASFVRTVAPDAQLIEVASYDEGVAMVIEGKADALVADMPVCVLSVARYPEAGLITLERPLTVEPVGIAVSKDDPQFFNLVDNYLRAYEKTGILGKIREKWFNDSSWVAALP